MPLRVVDDHEAFGGQQAGAIAFRNEPVDLRGMHGDGLFAQDMFAGLQGLQRPVDMHRIGQRDEDSVDAAMGQQRIVIVEDRDAWRESTERVRAPGLPGGNRGKGGIGRLVDRGPHVTASELGSPQDAPAQRIGHLAPFFRTDWPASLRLRQRNRKGKERVRCRVPPEKNAASGPERPATTFLSCLAAAAQALSSMPRSLASSCIRFWSFSKARTSICRILSRLTL